MRNGTECPYTLHAHAAHGATSEIHRIFYWTYSTLSYSAPAHIHDNAHILQITTRGAAHEGVPKGAQEAHEVWTRAGGKPRHAVRHGAPCDDKTSTPLAICCPPLEEEKK